VQYIELALEASVGYFEVDWDLPADSGCTKETLVLNPGMVVPQGNHHVVVPADRVDKFLTSWLSDQLGPSTQRVQKVASGG